MTHRAPLELHAGAGDWYFRLHHVLLAPISLAILISPTSWIWKMVLGTGMVVTLFLAMRQGLAMRRFFSVCLYPDGACTVTNRSGHEEVADLLSGVWTTRWMTILSLRTGDSVLRIPVCASSNQATDYRRMLVMIRNREFENSLKNLPVEP